MSAVGEAVTPEAVEWCLALLAQDRPWLVVGAALALENMAEVSGDPEFWTDLVDRLIYLLEEHAERDPQHRWISHLLRLVPPQRGARRRPRPRGDAGPDRAIPDWSRTQLNRHWSDCQSRAHAITDELGLPEQPVLARLLFDIAVGPHESRAVSGYMLVAAAAGPAPGGRAARRRAGRGPRRPGDPRTRRPAPGRGARRRPVRPGRRVAARRQPRGPDAGLPRARRRRRPAARRRAAQAGAPTSAPAPPRRTPPG